MLITEPILEAVRDTLQDELENITNPEKSIRITTDETAPPYAGEEFIGVTGGEITNDYPANWAQRKLVHTMSISYTRRLHGLPTDQKGETVYTYDKIERIKSSMTNRMHEIINIVDGSWDIVNLTRTALVASEEDICVMTPFGITSVDGAPRDVFADHFHITDVEDDTDRAIGLLMIAEFGGLTTYQTKYDDLKD